MPRFKMEKAIEVYQQQPRCLRHHAAEMSYATRSYHHEIRTACRQVDSHSRRAFIVEFATPYHYARRLSSLRHAATWQVVSEKAGRYSVVGSVRQVERRGHCPGSRPVTPRRHVGPSRLPRSRHRRLSEER